MSMVTGELTSMDCPWCYRKIALYLSWESHCKFCGKNVNPSRLALRIAKRIKELTGEDVRPYINRHYPGHWQRSEGAWVWEMEGKGISIGSAWKATIVEKAQEVSVIRDTGSIELLVEKE